MNLIWYTLVTVSGHKSQVATSEQNNPRKHTNCAAIASKKIGTKAPAVTATRVRHHAQRAVATN